MTKEQAIQVAEKLLMHIYDGQYEVVAKICTASANKDIEYLYHALNVVAKFIEELKKAMEGYHEAEKDLELTWEDMRKLYIIFAEINAEIEFCKTDIKAETIGYYQETLKRFKNYMKGE